MAPISREMCSGTLLYFHCSCPCREKGKRKVYKGGSALGGGEVGDRNRTLIGKNSIHTENGGRKGEKKGRNHLGTSLEEGT